MAQLGWTPVRVRDFTRGGYKEQVRGYVRHARAGQWAERIREQGNKVARGTGVHLLRRGGLTFHLYAGPSDHIGFHAGHHTPARAKAAVERRADGLDHGRPALSAPLCRVLRIA
jgi:hypothetical protein